MMFESDYSLEVEMVLKVAFIHYPAAKKYFICARPRPIKVDYTD